MAADEDSAKNLALMFFLDHLIQKNGRRSIHDLSCQFGARGFTTEMRQAVGGTKESLAEFLAQYPSLFSINDGQVTLKGIAEGSSMLGLGVGGGDGTMSYLGRNRDSATEAVKFFVEKLRKFGPELPIKSLLGHRSQASPDIRFVSGCHLRDFANFLACHPSSFVLVGDRVCLKEALDIAPGKGEPDGLNGESLTASQAAEMTLEFLKSFVEAQESPVSLEVLYREFCNRFPLSVRKHVATNPKELMQYLKTMRHLFFIRSNKVSLNRRRPLGDGENQQEDDQATDVSSSSSASRQQNGRAQIGLNEVSQSHCAITGRPVIARTLKAAVQAVQEIMYLQEDMIGSPELFRVMGVYFHVEVVGDVEFLSLISICLPGGQIFVFDLAHTASILLECGLKEILQSDEYLKVVHGSRKIANILWQHYRIRIWEVFDTQIAMLLIEHKETGNPLFKLQPVTLAAVLRFLEIKPANDFENALKELKGAVDSTFMNDVRTSIRELYGLFPNAYKALKSRLPADLVNLFYSMCHEAVNVHFGSVGNETPQALTLQHPYVGFGQQSKNNSKPCCCNCHAFKASTRNVASQTASTGDISSSKYYTESP
uniref:3'-5' exonuclease domain-containing protein n=1 Tax=Trichuris muris TaxID=70415 RepID=A0A5S6QV66_TRIMR